MRTLAIGKALSTIAVFVACGMRAPCSLGYLARGLHVLRVGDQDADARYKVYDFTTYFFIDIVKTVG